MSFRSEIQLVGSIAYSAPGDQSPKGDRRDRQILARRWPFPTRDGRFFSNSTAVKSYRSEARVELRSGRIDVSKLVSPAVADDIDLVPASISARMRNRVVAPSRSPAAWRVVADGNIEAEAVTQPFL